MRRVNKLSQMKIDEVSLVDRDANGYADMLIAKRDDSEEQMPPDDELTFSEEDLVYDEEGNAFLPLNFDAEADDGEYYDADDGEYYDEDEDYDEQAGDDTAQQVLEGLSKALGDSDRDAVIAQAYGEISKAQRRAQRAEQVAKYERDTRLNEEYISKAMNYSTPIPPEVLGPVLKRCSENLSWQDCQIIAQCLESAGEQNFDPFSEFGKSGGGDNADVLSRVNAAAEDLFSKGVDAGTGFTPEQAVAKVWEMNPDAYDEYLRDRRSLGR